MSSPSTLLTRGLGAWGSSGLLLTRGLGSGEEAPPVIPVAPPTDQHECTFDSTETTFDNGTITFDCDGHALAGVKKRIRRVRRADFSTQEAYELALKTAFADANYAFAEAAPEKQEQKTDSAIKISAQDFAKLQQATELDETELIMEFIRIIESNW